MIAYHELPFTLLIVIMLAGLALLCLGGDWLCKGAAGLALRLRISRLVVGLTVVSIATSMPELITSLYSARQGNPGLAVGNILGSNIANLGLILGITALICPVVIQIRLVKNEIPFLLIATVAFALMSFGGFLVNGEIGRVEGLVLLGMMVGYLLFVVREARRADPAEAKALVGEIEAAHSIRSCWFYVLAGAAMLALGAEGLVNGAVITAERLGVGQVLIGLTVVAIGTSLPELAASVAAAIRRESDIIAGNIVGSNIFNLLFVGGTVAALAPMEVERGLFRIEFPAMLLLTLLAWFMFFTDRKVSRKEGGMLLTLYVLIIILSAVNQGRVIS